MLNRMYKTEIEYFKGNKYELGILNISLLFKIKGNFKQIGEARFFFDYDRGIDIQKWDARSDLCMNYAYLIEEIRPNIICNLIYLDKIRIEPEFRNKGLMRFILDTAYSQFTLGTYIIGLNVCAEGKEENPNLQNILIQKYLSLGYLETHCNDFMILDKWDNIDIPEFLKRISND